jgi:hypothetical protein
MAERPSLDNLRPMAWTIAFFGLIPFAAFVLALLILGHFHPLHATLVDSFRLYSAVMLSFLGGIRWGLALREDSGDVRDLLFSIVPVIFGWAAMLLPVSYSLLVLLVAFCGQGAWDSFSFHRGIAPEWFAHLRIVMTLLVAFAHVVAFLAL